MTTKRLPLTYEQLLAQREFYRRTGHCGQCGRPAVTCSCLKSSPCGCWEDHRGNRDRAAEVETSELFDLVAAGPRVPKRTRSRRPA